VIGNYKNFVDEIEEENLFNFIFNMVED